MTSPAAPSDVAPLDPPAQTRQAEPNVDAVSLAGAPESAEALPPVTSRPWTAATLGGVPIWLLLTLSALSLVGAWLIQDRIEQTERLLARRIQDVEVRDAQREPMVRQLSDALRDSQAKVALLEAKLVDSLSQQSQLRAMYDEIARTRGDLMLADVENSIMIAAQQLQLGGNVQSALLALTDAELVLARSNPSALIGLRRVIALDIERLKAVPLSDFSAAVTRLDALLTLVDQLPLAADVRGAEAAGMPAAASTPPPTAGLRGLPERMARTGQAGWDALVAELRNLVRVQRVDEPDALLLSADQRFVARESLRVQLLNARLNLLARNETLFRSDLTRAIRSVEAWFDPQSKAVSAAVASLRQLQTARLNVELPTLADSVRAVRAARAASEAR